MKIGRQSGFVHEPPLQPCCRSSAPEETNFQKVCSRNWLIISVSPCHMASTSHLLRRLEDWFPSHHPKQKCGIKNGPYGKPNWLVPCICWGLADCFTSFLSCAKSNSLDPRKTSIFLAFRIPHFQWRCFTLVFCGRRQKRQIIPKTKMPSTWSVRIVTFLKCQVMPKSPWTSASSLKVPEPSAPPSSRWWSASWWGFLGRKLEAEWWIVQKAVFHFLRCFPS